MYFSRVSLNPLVEHQQLVQTLCRDSYREHQALWQLFDLDADASRDFLYRQTFEQGCIRYYLLSERRPLDHSGVWLIDGPKVYDPHLSVGQQLFFMLRVNPVVSVTDPEGKKARHDVVMHEKTRIGYKNLSAEQRPTLQQLLQDSCIPWLQRRTEHGGFVLEPGGLQVDGYRLHNNLAKGKKRPIRYSTVDFQGLLTVTDPELFKHQTLFRGMGKSRAFGCGLMLVRPA